MVVNLRQRTGPPPKNPDSLILGLSARGWGGKRIADALDDDPSYVNRRLRRLGVKPLPKTGRPRTIATTFDWMAEKMCGYCRAVKAIDAFPRDGHNATGRSFRCRACEAERARRKRTFGISICERDGWTCGICSMPIDRTAPRGAWHWSIDHIFPRSRGGSDDPTNLQAAHVGCNSRKGDATS